MCGPEAGCNTPVRAGGGAKLSPVGKDRPVRARKRVVDAAGFEPATPAVSRRCSPAELCVRKIAGSMNLAEKLSDWFSFAFLAWELRCQQRSPPAFGGWIWSQTQQLVSMGPRNPVEIL